MYITRSLRTIAWSTLAFSAARAQYIIDNLSFGQKEGQQISRDMRTIPHWVVTGHGDFVPEIMSDRVILTPPYPGNKRGSLWSQDPLHHSGDWTAELDFRASGMDRGTGNLQFWYTKESQAGQTPTGLYTAPKFDGLVLVIDQYSGHGGSVRGFLNDGTMDIKANPRPDSFAFGKCDYPYRNRGIISNIKLHHADGYLEVLIDGQTCFKTDKVNLPDGYYFGISASSAENPDSFEIHKFIVTTKNAYAREVPQSQRNAAAQQTHEQQTHQNSQQQPLSGGDTSIPKMLEDVSAATIRAQQDQFADLHNRIQIINNRVAHIQDSLDAYISVTNTRHADAMDRLVPIDDRVAATMRNVEKVERSVMEILKNLESKDFKFLMMQIHQALESNHDGLESRMPGLIRGHGPSLTMFICVAVAVQIMVTGAYVTWKKRRGGPKKYL